MEPILTWPGGKIRLAPAIEKILAPFIEGMSSKAGHTLNEVIIWNFNEGGVVNG